ncbi:hypothetical protein ABTX62_23955 [Streptomyces sp. NPDC096046]|uniref:hypothetical protein n=1 Tax=Streptomyces sp. NPDC096046 TaxID=3155542 RepID=UPI00333442AC
MATTVPTRAGPDHPCGQPPVDNQPRREPTVPHTSGARTHEAVQRTVAEDVPVLEPA